MVNLSLIGRLWDVYGGSLQCQSFIGQDRRVYDFSGFLVTLYTSIGRASRTKSNIFLNTNLGQWRFNNASETDIMGVPKSHLLLLAGFDFSFHLSELIFCFRLLLAFPCSVSTGWMSKQINSA